VSDHRKEVERGLKEIDALLTTALTNLFSNTTIAANNLRSIILSQLKYKASSGRNHLLEALAAINELDLRRRNKRSVARAVAESVVEKVPKGILEDCVASIVSHGIEYLRLMRSWERISMYAVDDTFWKKLSPEKVFLSEEEALELSERLSAIEREFGSNRKFLAPTLRNVRQLYTMYRVRRNFVIQRVVSYALYVMRNIGGLEQSRRLEIAGVAVLYAYRSWCRALADTFLPLVTYKVREVKSKLEKEDSPFVVVKSEVEGEGQDGITFYPTEDITPVAVESLPDETLPSPEEMVIEQPEKVWRYERLLDYCARLPLNQKKAITYGFGYTDPLLLEALVDRDRDWLPEALRQYVAKFIHLSNR